MQFRSYGVFGSEAAPPEGERLIVGRNNYVAFESGFFSFLQQLGAIDDDSEASTNP